jgi:hypothetical protein
MPAESTTDCACLETGPRFPDARRERDIGQDATDGRYADVESVRCTRCGRLWVKYFVEYEAFTGSGRWCEAPIDEALALVIGAAEVPAYLEAAPWFIHGGSYWGHAGKRGTGKLRWGP